MNEETRDKECVVQMKHVPVMLAEVLEALAVKRGGRYVDGTFGRGGHARGIVSAGGEILGIDRDDEAVSSAGELKVIKGRHGDIKKIVRENGWEVVDGILLDLGVSSPQLDEAGRGFSFLREGPLDMRMDRASGISAAELVNEGDMVELEHILWEYGEEREARRIVRAIKSERARGVRFETTVQFAEFIERIIGRHGGKSPATRTFQALRMAVNDEMGELERALEGGMEILKSGGRFAVITFESLTDRVVKRFFAKHIGKMVSLQQGGARWEGDSPRAKAVTTSVVIASNKEREENPRSRSAKLRVIERSNEV